jgi:signal peptidase
METNLNTLSATPDTSPKQEREKSRLDSLIDEKEELESTKKGIGHYVLNAIALLMCVVLVPALILNITLIVKSYFGNETVPSFGGYMPLIVLTDSMEPVMESGDLMIAQAVGAEEIEVGDIIAFTDPAGNGKSIVSHRVTSITQTEDGLAFTTKGDANNTEDAMAVSESDLIGTYVAAIPEAGRIALFMQSSTGIIICVIIPLFVLVGYDMIRRALYERKRRANRDALLKELEALRNHTPLDEE